MMRRKMEFGIEALEEAKARLIALPEKKKERFTAQEAVEFLYDEVQNALQKKYDIKEIFDIIRASGCAFSEKSLRYFSDIFNKIEAEKEKANRPKGKKKAALPKKEAQETAPYAPQPGENGAESEAQDLPQDAQPQNNDAEEPRQLGDVHGNDEQKSLAHNTQTGDNGAESAQKDHPNTAERKKKKEKRKATDEPHTADITPQPGDNSAEDKRQSDNDKAESARQDEQNKDAEEKNEKRNSTHFELEPDTEDL